MLISKFCFSKITAFFYLAAGGYNKFLEEPPLNSHRFRLKFTTFLPPNSHFVFPIFKLTIKLKKIVWYFPSYYNVHVPLHMEELTISKIKMQSQRPTRTQINPNIFCNQSLFSVYNTERWFTTSLHPIRIDHHCTTAPRVTCDFYYEMRRTTRRSLPSIWT